MPRAAKSAKSLPFTGNEEADRYLVEDPLALLIGMVLDQQVPLEKAFAGPWVLRQRLGRELDAAAIADMDPDELAALFVERPALHRFPGSMAARVQELCRILVQEYGGDADCRLDDRVERRGAVQAREGAPRLRRAQGPDLRRAARPSSSVCVPKAGRRPPGPSAAPGALASVADIDSPAALVAVREHKRAMKAAKAPAKTVARSARA